VIAFRHAALVLFFLGLAALEVAHGLYRLRTIRREHHDQVRDVVERQFADMAGRLRLAMVEGREHALHLARLPSIRLLLDDAEASSGGSARSQAEAHLLAYLVSFRRLDGIRILDAAGRERSRCERIGGGVGVLPESYLSAEPAGPVAALARDSKLGEVFQSALAIDRERVEVPESDRQVFHYSTAVGAEGRRLGALVLTVYATPFLEAVRKFAPIAGISSCLVDGDARYIACSDRGRELGQSGAGDFLSEFPHAAALLKDAVRLDGPEEFFAAEALSDSPPLRLVLHIPASALEAASGGRSADAIWTIASSAAITALLAMAAVFFVRLSVRELRLRELARRKAMERQLEISERLGSLGLLTASVAHEINNPLEGIGNYLALMEKDSLPPDQRKRYLELVRHGFHRIRDIVRDLLTFARPSIHDGSADLAQVVRQAIKLAGYGKETKGIGFELQGLDAPLLVPGDPGRLEQVFINLFHNAGRAMAGGGTITVRAGRAAGNGARAPAVEVAVEDSGPGIPPEHLGRLFDPFFSTSGGTGLGLSISYGIVSAHGGTLEAGNRAEGGARFTVRLPASRPPSKSRTGANETITS
jgi:signal transduction histidine kinase